jgi:hypothetical protein
VKAEFHFEGVKCKQAFTFQKVPEKEFVRVALGVVMLRCGVVASGVPRIDFLQNFFCVKEEKFSSTKKTAPHSLR